MIDRLFFEHPRAVRETYAEHFGVAGRFGATMVVGGLACIVHAIVPGLFVRTGSATVKKLYGEMVSRQPTLAKPAYREAEWQLEYEI
jgi:hypothetical protein